MESPIPDREQITNTDRQKAVTLYPGDCREVLQRLPDQSVHSIVTDPPYGLMRWGLDDLHRCLLSWLSGDVFRSRRKGFSGLEWDGQIPGPEVWRECLRVLRPGGHLLAFAGTRTMDLLGLSLRLAGFELRDSIGYASDAEGPDCGGAPLLAWVHGNGMPKGGRLSGDFNGWGSCLKPAWEPVLLARKPIECPSAQKNMDLHQTGALNIDGCRVEHVTVRGGSRAFNPHLREGISGGNGGHVLRMESERRIVKPHPGGRWPANVIHDGSETVIRCFPEESGARSPARGESASFFGRFTGGRDGNAPFYGDTGTAARFYYCAKASSRDRSEGLKRRNPHPTVKPTDLMRYLCRLVTPPGGVVLDPYMGSGSTGKAAVLEGFRFVGIERDSGYLEIARKRIAHARRSIRPGRRDSSAPDE